MVITIRRKFFIIIVFIGFGLLLCSGQMDAKAATLPQKLELVFTSGGGAWFTGITVQEDGKFTGDFHDSDMGVVGEGFPNGTVYTSSFFGKFKIKDSDEKGKYLLKMTKLKTKEQKGREWIDKQFKYIAIDPYGLESGKKYSLYCPGYSIEELPENAKSCLNGAGWIRTEDDILQGYVLYNKKNGHTFYGK